MPDGHSSADPRNPRTTLATTMMSILLSTLLFIPFSYATALNNTISHEYALSSSCSGSRTLWSIILSCVTTLFACAWTAIHPNIPGPVESGVVVGARRLFIMSLALAAPELVVIWAIRQLFAARITQKQFQKALRDGTLELRVEPRCKPRLVSRTVPRDADEVRIMIPEKVIESASYILPCIRYLMNAY